MVPIETAKIHFITTEEKKKKKHVEIHSLVILEKAFIPTDFVESYNLSLKYHILRLER